jgi:ABC-type nitrate/sulfonate/bicarbonate transport system substrate-binding protein
MSNNMNRRTAVRALGAGLLSGGATPFFHVQSYGQNQPTKVSLTLPFTLHGSYTAFIAARELGYWKDRGVDVTVSRGFGSPDAIKRVHLGQFDYGDASFESVIQAASEGLDVVGLGLHMHVSPLAIFSLKKSGIKQPKDLEGKVLGAAPTYGDWLFFPAFARATGIDRSKITVRFLDGNVRAQTLLNGGVDALTGYYNLDAPPLWTGGGDIDIMLHYKYGLKVYGTGLLALRSQVEKFPQVTKAVVEGVMEGYKYTYLNPNEALNMHIASMRELQGSDRAREITKYQMLLNTALGVHPAPKQHGLGYYVPQEVAENVALAKEFLSLEKDVDPKKLVTNDFVGTVKLTPAEWETVEKSVKPYILW